MSTQAKLGGRRILRWGATLLGVVLIGGGLVVHAAYRHDLEAARVRIAAGGKVLTTPYGRLEYAEAGHGYPVLVLHGAGGGYDQGLLIGRLLLGDNYRLIAPSRFGYLNSSVPEDYSPKAQADAYRYLLQTLGIEKAIVVAFSAGGPSGLQFTLNYPKSTTALVTVSAVSYTRHVSPPGDYKGAILNGQINSDFPYWFSMKFLRPLLLTGLGVSSAVQGQMTSEDKVAADRLLEDMLPISRRIAAVRLDQSIAGSTRPDDRLAGIKVPTLVIHARDDTLVGIADGEYTASVIPGAKFVPVEKGGHFLVTQYATLRRTVTGFIESVRSSQASAGRAR